MPTYEYKCRDCGEIFEKFQSMNDAPLEVCEICGGSVKRLLGIGAGIIFKGSGFYETDYRKEDYRKKAAAEGKAADSGSDKAEGGKVKKSDGEPKKQPESAKSTAA